MVTEIEKTKQIWDYYNDKVGHILADRIVLKVCAICSSQLPFPRFDLLDSAPSGQFKTWTSNIARELCPKKWSLPLNSDFTLHGLNKDTKGNIDKKCLMINDGTLWLSSLAQRTQQRVINALAVIETDEKYSYSNFNQNFTIHGRISLILNLTTRSYTNKLRSLLDNTFDERDLTVHSELSPEELQKTFLYFSTDPLNTAISIGVCESRASRKVENTIIPNRFEKLLWQYTAEYSGLSVKGQARTQATIRAMVRANAFLNGRPEVCKEDFWVVERAKEYLVNPLEPNKPRIIRLLQSKISVAEVCRELGKDPEKYDAYVYRVQREAKGKGLLA